MKQNLIDTNRAYDNLENQYGILLKHVCGSCDTRFDDGITKNESEMHSGEVSCPNCGSQYNSVNCPDEIDRTPSRIIIKIGDYKESLVIEQTHLRDFLDQVRSAGAPESYSYLENFLMMEYLTRTIPKLGKKHTLEMLEMIINKMDG